MALYSGTLGEVAWAVLLAGFAYAAYTDVRTREAPDGVWQILGAAGAVLGLIAIAPEGRLPLLCWLVVCALILQHFFAWDLRLERLSEALPGLVEIALYIAAGLFLLLAARADGLSNAAVPPIAVAAFVVVVLIRACFELGLLYGGADAKALLAAATLIPLAPVVVYTSAASTALSQVLPGPLTLLMNAALLSVSVPIVIAFRNLRDGSFEGAASFVGYPIPVSELSHRFVWLKDPVFSAEAEEEREAETSEDDQALRVRQQAELESRGVARVWVTPQLPFLVFFLAGAVATLLAGNLLFDLLSHLP